MNPALSILITLACLGAIIAFSALGLKKGKLSAEMARKSVHVGMGFICLSFPWLFDSVTPVQLLAGVAVMSLLIVRLSKLRSSVGASLFSVKRISIGELLFPLAVAWLFTLSWGNPVLYVIPLLLLTLADTAGALAGVKYGKNKYQTVAATKSLEGSICFFLTAFLCIALPLYIASDLSLSLIIFLSLTVSLFCMAIEGASGHGLDNLLIPIGAFLLLDYYLRLSSDAIFIRSIVIIALLALLLLTRKKHTFDGGTTLIAALYGFAAFTMGGIPCFLAALIVFVRHLIAQQKMKPHEVSTHSAEVITAIAIPSLFWLTLGRMGSIDYQHAQLGFITALSLTIYMSHIGTQQYLGNKKPSLIKGFMLSILVLVTALTLDISISYLIPALVASIPAALMYFYWNKQSDYTSGNNWFKLGLLASLFSTICMLTALL